MRKLNWVKTSAKLVSLFVDIINLNFTTTTNYTSSKICSYIMFLHRTYFLIRQGGGGGGYILIKYGLHGSLKKYSCASLFPQKKSWRVVLKIFLHKLQTNPTHSHLPLLPGHSLKEKTIYQN